MLSGSYNENRTAKIRRMKSKTGRANINFHNVDNMEFMKGIEDNHFELAITDPPYGIDIAKWDKSIPTDEYFKELFRVSKNQIIWGGNYFNLPHTEAWICWDKTFNETVRGKSMSLSKIKKENISEFELAWTSFLKKSRFLRYMNLGNLQGFDNNIKVDYNKMPKIHITQKPVQLYKWLLKNYAKEGDKILDTHGGSCSIALAAWDMKYDLDVCELDSDYFNAAWKRFDWHSRQTQLF